MFKVLTIALITSIALAASQFKTIHVADLSGFMKGSTVYVFDANGESTRKGVGIIPGAHLLSNFSKYDVKKELPADKKAKLVFYCANTRCTSSHTAADRAIDAGYTDVSVMVDGVYGWKKANEPLESITKGTISVEPKVASELLSLRKAILIDVRETEERHEVIAQAQSVPLSKLETPKEWQAFVAGLPKDKTLIVHCAAGRRAKKVSEKLSEEGFKTVYFEGPDQWKKAGFPLEKGNAD